MAVLAGRGVRRTLYDIRAARVRERLRQGGILVASPTDLFDTPPKRENDQWHFLCLSRYDREWVAKGHDATLLSLETLISHVVLIASHLTESRDVIARREKIWLANVTAERLTLISPWQFSTTHAKTSSRCRTVAGPPLILRMERWISRT